MITDISAEKLSPEQILSIMSKARYVLIIHDSDEALTYRIDPERPSWAPYTPDASSLVHGFSMLSDFHYASYRDRQGLYDALTHDSRAEDFNIGGAVDMGGRFFRNLASPQDYIDLYDMTEGRHYREAFDKLQLFSRSFLEYLHSRGYSEVQYEQGDHVHKCVVIISKDPKMNNLGFEQRVKDIEGEVNKHFREILLPHDYEKAVSSIRVTGGKIGFKPGEITHAFLDIYPESISKRHSVDVIANPWINLILDQNRTSDPNFFINHPAVIYYAGDSLSSDAAAMRAVHELSARLGGNIKAITVGIGNDFNNHPMASHVISGERGSPKTIERYINFANNFLLRGIERSRPVRLNGQLPIGIARHVHELHNTIGRN